MTPPRTATDTGGAQAGAVGEEDFAGLRPFQAGDSLRRVAWKAYARGQGLHTKQFAGTDVVSHVFDYGSLAGLGVEARLEQLCRWVLDAQERGEAFALRLPGTSSRRTSARPSRTLPECAGTVRRTGGSA